METVKILQNLCSCFCPSGNEGGTAKAIEQLISPLCENIRTDFLGNLTAEITPVGKKTIALMAHMDKISLRITSIDRKSGFLRIAPCGGIDARCLSAQRVKVIGKKTLDGTIISTPPHLARGSEKTAAEIKNLAIDCGLSFDEISQAVCVGDSALLYAPFTELKNGCINAPFIDNSAGCAVIIRVMELLKNKHTHYKITAVFTTREETGKQGAATAAFSLKADEAIVTDVSFAAAPDVREEDSSPAGSGVMIGCSAILDREMFIKLKEQAKKNNIPYTVEAVGNLTHTDADVTASAGAGIKTALASVPLKNMHTPAELVNLGDIEAAAELIAAYLTREDD